MHGAYKSIEKKKIYSKMGRGYKMAVPEEEIQLFPIHIKRCQPNL